MKCWALVGVLALVGLVVATDDDHWENHKQAHNLQFDCPHKHNKSKATFLKNKNFVNEHNQKYAAGQVVFHLALNSFSHLSQDEVKTQLHGRVAHKAKLVGTTGGLETLNLNGVTVTYRKFAATPGYNAPATKNWASQCSVPVKNQNPCGCCWAFAAATALEYNWCSQKKVTTQPLAPQQIVDCFDRSHDGCKGWSELLGLNYVKQTSTALATEANYPFVHYNSEYEIRKQTCKQANSPYYNSIKELIRVEQNYNAVMEALNVYGALAVGIDASGSQFQNYKSGIYSCTSGNVGHAVTLVGYGSENGRDYWLIQNSWGNWWGEKGFLKMSRSQSTNPAASCGMLNPNGYTSTVSLA